MSTSKTDEIIEENKGTDENGITAVIKGMVQDERVVSLVSIKNLVVGDIVGTMPDGNGYVADEYELPASDKGNVLTFLLIGLGNMPNDLEDGINLLDLKGYR